MCYTGGDWLSTCVCCTGGDWLSTFVCFTGVVGRLPACSALPVIDVVIDLPRRLGMILGHATLVVWWLDCSLE